MKTKILTLLLCLLSSFAIAQNYEQQGDELFKQALYEQAAKKYKAAEVTAEMEGKKASSQLTQKKEKALKCANLLKKATSAEENNRFSEAAKTYEDLYALHALAAYQKKSQTLKSKSSSQSNGTRITSANNKQKTKGTVDLIIPDGVTEIKESEYSNRQDIKSVVIPNSVTSIGKAAFWNCIGLTSVTIPNSVTSIGESAFSECSGLTSIEIPSGVTNIEDFVFYRCIGLTSVKIGNGVTSIGESTFEDCHGLTFVTIPNSVTSISFNAFEGCTNLTSVTIPNSVTILKGAFRDCSKLKLKLPERLRGNVNEKYCKEVIYY